MIFVVEYIEMFIAKAIGNVPMQFICEVLSTIIAPCSIIAVVYYQYYITVASNALASHGHDIGTQSILSMLY